MRVLIVDDEPRAHAAVASLLRGKPDVEAFSPANVIEVLENLSKNSHEVLLLVVRMPEVSGFGSTDQWKRNGRSIHSAILAGVAEKRHIDATQPVDRVGNSSSNKWLADPLNQASEKTPRLRSAKPAGAPPQPWHTEKQKSGKIAIKVKGRIVFVDPKKVVSVHAEGNYVLLQKSSGSLFIRATISEMVGKLEPYGFIRIHRSLLVNALFVEEIRPYSTGGYGLYITGGKQYTVSRTYKNNLRSLASCWVGIDTFIE
jgi:DNA-binding LytR/AlgR family response regulator